MNDDDFQFYINRLFEEDSFFALIEAGDDILPKLEAQFQKESLPGRRAAIIRIIWEYRNPKSLDMLALALSDPSELIWQEALNGFVAIGGERAKELMRSMLPASDHFKKEWIIEALEQIQE